MAESPAGLALIAAVDMNRRVRIWESATRTARDPEAPFTANHLTFSPDGRFLAAHDGGPIRVHDVVTGQSRFEIEVYSGSSDLPLALSPGAELLAFSGSTPVIELWSVAREKRRTRLTGHTGVIQEFSFSSDGNRLLSRSKDGTILIWDVSAWD